MKRIRTLVTLAIIVCLSIGTFYIYAAAEVKGYPKFYIKKEAGDDKEIRSLTLSATLSMGQFSEPVMISAAGSKYERELSFTEQLNSSFLANDGLQVYRDKYHNFMRGKLMPDSFYEDSESLVFAGVDYKRTNRGLRDFSFTIAQLHKKNKDESSFQIKVPGEANDDFISVNDVQKHGGELDVFTTNSVSDHQAGASKTELHCYRFDLAKKKLLSDQILLSARNAENNTENRIYNLSSTTKMAPEKYYVFVKDSRPVSSPDENGKVSKSSVKRELYAYNMKTNAVQSFAFPKELSMVDTMINYYHGPLIYFVTPDANAKAVKVLIYNMETKKAAGQYTIPIEEIGEDTKPDIFIKDNRMYLLIVNHDQTGRVDIQTNYIMVCDLQNGKILYKGKVIPKPGKGNSLPKGTTLHVENMNVGNGL